MARCWIEETLIAQSNYRRLIKAWGFRWVDPTESSFIPTSRVVTGTDLNLNSKPDDPDAGQLQVSLRKEHQRTIDPSVS